VADAWERICPPIGFKAPPATNVMVAPGSARESVNHDKERETMDGGMHIAPDL